MESPKSVATDERDDRIEERAAPTAPEADEPARPRLLRGLSGKLLALTVLFVMIGEVLIYVPSIANFRITWLNDRIAAAQIATLVLEAAPDNMVSEELRRELLRSAGAKAVALKRGDTRQLVLKADQPLEVDRHTDLRDFMWMSAIYDAFDTLLAGDGRIVRVVGAPPQDSGNFLEIVIDETPLRAAMLRYSINILTLSIVLSLIVAAFVFLALNWLLVRPLRRMTRAMLHFSGDPEDTSRIVAPSNRQDEIGVMSRELNRMQSELTGMLQQKSRLAALGLAVSKISHDLRNMLASAQLISDRLGQVNDPTVQKFAPKLIASLDRAISFCAQTLKYGRVKEAPPRRERFALHGLVEEVVEAIAPQASSRVVLYNEVPPDLEIDADRDHLHRILLNLTRNAVQALEQAADAGRLAEDGRVRVRAWRDRTGATMEVADNGPGVPARARAHLFEAFQAGTKPGSAGLGLAISGELARAHGGELRLVDSPSGAVFHVVIPDRVAELRPGRRGERRISAGSS